MLNMQYGENGSFFNVKLFSSHFIAVKLAECAETAPAAIKGCNFTGCALTTPLDVQRRRSSLLISFTVQSLVSSTG
jgi:hypothetical protein